MHAEKILTKKQVHTEEVYNTWSHPLTFPFISQSQALATIQMTM